MQNQGSRPITKTNFHKLKIEFPTSFRVISSSNSEEQHGKQNQNSQTHQNPDVEFNTSEGTEDSKFTNLSKQRETRRIKTRSITTVTQFARRRNPTILVSRESESESSRRNPREIK